MITIELLKSWKPCVDGFKRFCELFPNGTDLENAGKVLADDGHDDWGLWLYERSREDGLFDDVTIKGYQNTGNQNTGNWNTGNQNTGDWNTGNQNTGNWNTGNRNTGFFNTISPDTVLVFNRPCARELFDITYKPSFLFFDLTYWVDESNMTDAEKAADPDFHIRGGQLRKKEYKQAFRESWDKADEVDRERVRELPNFDAEIFFEISGIDLR